MFIDRVLAATTPEERIALWRAGPTREERVASNARRATENHHRLLRVMRMEKDGSTAILEQLETISNNLQGVTIDQKIIHQHHYEGAKKEEPKVADKGWYKDRFKLGGSSGK